jgi:hypothetical protein
MGSVDGGGDEKPVAVRMGGEMVGGCVMVVAESWKRYVDGVV